MDSFEREVDQGHKLKVDLTDKEIKMFERLMQMEAVHNQIGEVLGRFKESIVETRNDFFGQLQKKYRFDNPSKVTYDPKRQKIVSIFNPDLKIHRIIGIDYGFEQLASAKIVDLINELHELYANIKNKS